MKVKNTDLKLFNQYVTSNFLNQIFQVTYIVYRMLSAESAPRILFTLSDLFQFISCPVLKAVVSCWRIFPQLCVGLCLQCHLSNAILLLFLDATRSSAQSGCCLFLLPSITCSDGRAGVSLCLSQEQLLVANTAQGHCSPTGLVRLQTSTFVLLLFLCMGGSELMISYLLGTRNN